MRLLLDTHVFLWWRADAPQLPAGARAAGSRAGGHFRLRYDVSDSRGAITLRLPEQEAVRVRQARARRR